MYLQSKYVTGTNVSFFFVFVWSPRSLKEAFIRSVEYSDRQVTNVLLMIITVIAETLTSLLTVSTMVYLSQNLLLYFGFCNCLIIFFFDSTNAFLFFRRVYLPNTLSFLLRSQSVRPLFPDKFFMH